jgi:hypothetical protein
MRRWLVTISLTLAMLSNTTWGVHCGPSGADSNVADCCKDGMCPHHLSGQESQSCPHTLSPNASLSLIILSALPAMVNDSVADPIQLEVIGTATELVTPNIIQTALAPFTPPPEL